MEALTEKKITDALTWIAGFGSLRDALARARKPDTIRIRLAEIGRGWNEARSVTDDPEVVSILDDLRKASIATAETADETGLLDYEAIFDGEEVVPAEDEPLIVSNWFPAWVGSEGYRMSPTGVVTLGRESLSAATLERRAYQALERLGRGSPNVTALRIAIEVWREEAAAEYREEVRSNLAFRPEVREAGAAAWDDLLRAVTGRADPVEVAAFQHFAWQVKRKLSRLEVSDHLMPILFGKTGSGKSELVKRLIRPLAGLDFRPKSVSILQDERFDFGACAASIVFFDEMAKASKTDVESIKEAITRPYADAKRLYTNNIERLPNFATFIGASNRDLRDLINDPTSVRRYFQIETLPVMDWDAINGLDYELLWRSVDETSESPIKPLLSEVRARQEPMRNKTVTEEFFDACVSIGGGKVTGGALYSAFKEFAEFSGVKVPPSNVIFGREIKDLLKVRGSEVPLRSGGIVVYRVTLSDAYRRTDVPEESSSTNENYGF